MLMQALLQLCQVGSRTRVKQLQESKETKYRTEIGGRLLFKNTKLARSFEFELNEAQGSRSRLISSCMVPKLGFSLVSFRDSAWGTHHQQPHPQNSNQNMLPCEDESAVIMKILYP